MPPVPAPSSGRTGAEHPPAAQSIALGEFVGSARWVTTGRADPAPSEYEAGDGELGLLLGAIAEDVHQITAAVRAGILADFAARAAHARRHLPRHQIADALAAIKQARAAALAVAGQNAKAELQGRKKAAIATRRRPSAKRPAALPSNTRG
jgi:hypothetical protein